MRIRNRKVPLPLSSLSPIPLSDPQFSRPSTPVVQLQLHNSPHQNRFREPPKYDYFDLQLPSDQPIGGGGSKGHDDSSFVDGPQEEEKKKVLIIQEGETKGGDKLGLGEKSNDTGKGSFLSEGVHITVLQPASCSRQGVGRWGEEEKVFPLKKRRGSFERRVNEETIMEKDKKMKTKMKAKMSKKCVKQEGDNDNEEEQEEGKGRKQIGSSSVKTKARGGALLEGSRCSRVNGRGWRCCQQTLVGYSLCEHHLGKGRLRSMNSVRNRSMAAAAAPKKAVDVEFPALSTTPSLCLKKEETKGASSDDKVGDEDDKDQKPLTMSKRKMKLGMVKARSISSLLGQANNAIGGPRITSRETIENHGDEAI